MKRKSISNMTCHVTSSTSTSYCAIKSSKFGQLREKEAQWLMTYQITTSKPEGNAINDEATVFIYRKISYLFHFFSFAKIRPNFWFGRSPTIVHMFDAFHRIDPAPKTNNELIHVINATNLDSPKKRKRNKQHTQHKQHSAIRHFNFK